jgi:hypothetical protein
MIFSQRPHHLLKREQITMNQRMLGVMAIVATVASLFAAPVRAEDYKNTIGPAIVIGGGSSTLGIDSKFAINDTLSVRPFVYFPSGGTAFGSGLTYDFNNVSKSNRVKITPFLGGGISIASGSNSNTSSTVVFLTGGADFGINENVELKAALNIPFSSGVSTTSVVLGAGYRF